MAPRDTDQSRVSGLDSSFYLFDDELAGDEFNRICGYETVLPHNSNIIRNS